MITKLMSSLTKVKHWQAYIAAILITLLFCLIWPSLSGEGQEDYWPVYSNSQGTSTADSDLETRMAETLSAIKGVGRVSVIISYEDEVVQAFSTTKQKPKGAVVVAEGASEISVKMELCRAVHALLGIDMASIEVFQMRNTQ